MKVGIFSIVGGLQKPPLSKLFLLNKRRIVTTMPKTRKYIPSLQKQRLMKKNKFSDDGPTSTSYLQIIGSGAIGAARSLYFFTDRNRYMFNAGEGTQRIAHEHGVKISRMEHIFFTYPIWDNIGGLPGLALTLQECGLPDLTIHGPKGLSSLFEVTKRFVVLNNMNIQSIVCEKNKSYKDGSVIIEYIPLVSNNPTMFLDARRTKSEILPFGNGGFNRVVFPSPLAPVEALKIVTDIGSRCPVTDIIQDFVDIKDEIDYYAYQKNGDSASASSCLLSEATKMCMNSRPASLPIAMAYICSLTPKTGTLSLEMCVERGVPPGPLLGKLKAGEDITLPNGVIVKSEDVRSPDEKGPYFIVVDCPSIDFLESLINEEAFRKFQAEELDSDTILTYIFHFTPSKIMHDERYQAWMQKFPKSALHVNINDRNKCLGCVGLHKMQYTLNKLDSRIFPNLADDSIPIFHPKPCETTADRLFEIAKANKDNSAIYTLRSSFNLSDDCGNTLRLLGLRPSNYSFKNVADCVYLIPACYDDELNVIEGFARELEALKIKLESLNPTIERIREKWPYPRITFLGTGSSIPNKCRNTSGILASLSDDNHILMDCGEGTYGQIVRHFGSKRTAEILANLNIIFVSHLHADHHMGLINILKHRREAVELLDAKFKKAFLLAPQPILFWLINYQQQFEEVFDCIEFVFNHDLEYRSERNVIDFHKQLREIAPLQDIVTSYVRHCAQAYGISFTHENGCKVTYSGDTMPTKDLINIGKNSHLLIHEATFEDNLLGEAKQKYHSTTSEAIAVGVEMEAEFTLLTHFSQRYYKMPLITNSFTENVGIAFDNMEVTMSDLPKLHLFNPILQLIFEDQLEAIRTKNVKRKRMESL